MSTKISTNNHWREYVHRSDVPAKVLADQFDYLDEDTTDGFFCYRGYWYHTSQFMRINYPRPSSPNAEWDAFHNDSAFSGVLIKVSPDGELFKVGTFTS